MPDFQGRTGLCHPHVKRSEGQDGAGQLSTGPVREMSRAVFQLTESSLTPVASQSWGSIPTASDGHPCCDCHNGLRLGVISWRPTDVSISRRRSRAGAKGNWSRACWCVHWGHPAPPPCSTGLRDPHSGLVGQCGHSGSTAHLRGLASASAAPTSEWLASSASGTSPVPDIFLPP